MISYSQTIDDVYENTEDYIPKKKPKVLVVFDVMLVDMEANKKLKPVAAKLIIRERAHSIFFSITILF